MMAKAPAMPMYWDVYLVDTAQQKGSSNILSGDFLSARGGRV